MAFTQTDGINFNQGGSVQQNPVNLDITVQTGSLADPGRAFLFGKNGYLGSTGAPLEGVIALNGKITNAPVVNSDIANKAYVDSTVTTAVQTAIPAEVATETYVRDYVASAVPPSLATESYVDNSLANAGFATQAYVDNAVLNASAAPVAWTAPALLNGFTNYVNSTGGASAGYRKVGNRVELRGLVSGGIKGQVIFILPAACRPKEGTISKQLQLVGNVADKFATILVRTTGEVLVSQHDATALTWASLNGISFHID